jgi:O-succinylbenzoic acid--CoA ligase
MLSDKTNEQNAHSFFEGWHQNQTEFGLNTSGSTGHPKSILLNREKMIWSAQKTFEAYFTRSINKYQLCCLPVTKVGGLMQLVRSAVWNTPIDVVEPSSNPLLNYYGTAAITSLTPMQLAVIVGYEESKHILHQFHTVLIGGGEISVDLENQLLLEYPDTRWIHTFGMTETYSHFAGRFLGEKQYKVLPETDISLTSEGTLQLRNLITNHEWLATNDLIEIVNSDEFIWKGRIDFTINSGGVKIQLETVESEIAKMNSWPMNSFCCWYEGDDTLGQKLILLTTQTNVPQNWNFTNPYFKPKEVYTVETLCISENGKINRLKSYELAKIKST